MWRLLFPLPDKSCAPGFVQNVTHAFFKKDIITAAWLSEEISEFMYYRNRMSCAYYNHATNLWNVFGEVANVKLKSA